MGRFKICFLEKSQQFLPKVHQTRNYWKVSQDDLKLGNYGKDNNSSVRANQVIFDLAATSRVFSFCPIAPPILKNGLFLYVWLFCLHSMSAHHVCAWCLWGQKRMSHPLELELQMVLSHYLGAKNWTWVLCQSSQCSCPVSCLSSLHSSYILLTCGWIPALLPILMSHPLQPSLSQTGPLGIS